MSVVHIITREHGDILDLDNCHQTMWMFSDCAELVLPLTGWGALESWLHLSLEKALWRVGLLLTWAAHGEGSGEWKLASTVKALEY